MICFALQLHSVRRCVIKTFWSLSGYGLWWREDVSLLEKAIGKPERVTQMALFRCCHAFR